MNTGHVLMEGLLSQSGSLMRRLSAFVMEYDVTTSAARRTADPLIVSRGEMRCIWMNCNRLLFSLLSLARCFLSLSLSLSLAHSFCLYLSLSLAFSLRLSLSLSLSLSPSLSVCLCLSLPRPLTLSMSLSLRLSFSL